MIYFQRLAFSLSLMLCAGILSASERPALKAVKEVSAIHLDQPIAFLSDGKWTTETDVLLIHVAVADPSQFLPHDAPSPQFVYGDRLCRLVKSPMDGTGVAAILAPVPAAGTTPALWLSPELPSNLLTQNALHSYFAKPPSKLNALAVAIPAPPATRQSYKTLDDLRRVLATEKTK